MAPNALAHPLFAGLYFKHEIWIGPTGTCEDVGEKFHMVRFLAKSKVDSAPEAHSDVVLFSDLNDDGKEDFASTVYNIVLVAVKTTEMVRRYIEGVECCDSDK